MNGFTNPIRPALIMVTLLALFLPRPGITAAGDRDSSFGRFGNDGIVPLAGMSTRDMALLPNGKIIIIGSNGSNLIIRRLMANGDFDPGFGSNGIVTVPMGNDDACENYLSSPFACGIAVHQDGRFVVVGTYSAGSNNDFAVLSFLANGELDTSFGLGGLATVDFDSRKDFANDVGIQDDGKIVIAGTASFEGNKDLRMGIARLNGDGSLDTSFSNDGKQNISFGVGTITNHRDHSGNALALQGNGKIVIVGNGVDYGTVTQNYDFGVARLNQDGSLDNTFSGDGRKRVGFGDNEIAYDVEIDRSNGDIVIVGGASANLISLGKQYAVARLDVDGNLDNTFSDDGRILLNQVADVEETLIAVDLQPDGKIVAIGHADTKIQMIRLSHEGLFDSSFSGDGIFTPKSGNIESNFITGLARDIIIKPDGNYLLLYGDALIGFDPDLTRASGGPAVTIDLWSNDGVVVTDFGNREDRAWDVKPQGDGKIIVVGDSKDLNSGATGTAVARYLTNGELDTSFSFDGMFRIRGLSDQFARSAAILNNKEILIGGFTRSTQTGDLNCMLNRVSQNGSSASLNQYPIGEGDDICIKILVQDDGKNVLVGYTQTPTTNTPSRYGIALIRLLPNDQFDTSFNGTGKVITNIGNGLATRARDATLQADGKILVTGTHDGDILVMRYNTNGTLDTSFGVNGIVLADHGGVVESGVTTEQKTDVNGASLIDIGFGIDFIYQEHIAVGGLVDGVDFGILVLDPDGKKCSVCGLFAGTHYFRTIDFGYTESAYGFAVQDNGSMVLTGGESSGDSGVMGARIKRNRIFEGPGYKIDTAFSGDGKVQFISKFRSSARANTLFGSDIFIAGFRSNGHDDDFFLMKLENDSETWPYGANLMFADGFED